MRASFSAGGTSAAAMRCANPSTIAVFPTPALPINAGLFLLCRSRMSTTRAISASRQRTGSKSPRRACTVRSTPTRSSTAPESNSPSNGSPIRSPRPQEPQVPVDDGVAEHEHDGRPHGEEYPERDVALLAPEQEPDDRLDDRVLQRDGVSAPATSTAQQQPRDDGDVVPPRDRLPAARTSRGGAEEGALPLVFLRQAQDADVQEAPEAEPEESGSD